MTGYFAELERELVAAAERRRGESRSRHAGRSRRLGGRRIRAAAVGLVMLAVAVPAAAVTGVFRAHLEPDGLVRLSEQRVIVDGTAPTRGHWQLLASQSDQGFCLGIRLPNHFFRGDTSTRVSEGCGTPPPGSLTVATSSGGSLPTHGVTWGMTPEHAVRVRVEARGASVTVPTVDDHLGLAGRFYVAELPFTGSLGTTTVIALDSKGPVLGTPTLP
ncbi:MAG: hypothetical protein WKF96_19435 [Solirubrobacteraceae bacterium]